MFTSIRNWLRRGWSWCKRYWTEGSATVVVVEGVLHAGALLGAAYAAVGFGQPWLAVGLVALAAIESLAPIGLAYAALSAKYKRTPRASASTTWMVAS